MGDFYEMFYEGDALVAARAIEITLTSRYQDANGGRNPHGRRAVSRVDGTIARARRKRIFGRHVRTKVEDPVRRSGIVQRENSVACLALVTYRRELSRRSRDGVSLAVTSGREPRRR